MGWANNESTINWAWSCERSIDVLMNLWVKAVLAWLGWIGLFVGLWPLAGNKPTKKTSKPREACEWESELVDEAEREAKSLMKSIMNGMNNWWNGWLALPLSLRKQTNARAVRRRTTQPKPTILCGWAWKASKELVWLLRLHSLFSINQMEWRLIGCAAPSLQAKLGLRVVGYMFSLQQQLILHSSLIDCLIVLWEERLIELLLVEGWLVSLID